MQSSLPQFTFKWPKGPEAIILTGTFDDWKGTLPMVKDPSGAFEITLPVTFDSPSSKFYFKFIVDGQWLPSKDYKVNIDEGVENNFITEEDVIKQRENGSSTLVPESAGLAVSKNAPLIEPEAEKRAKKLRKFKIKRVIKTNKQTGERSIFSQEVVELPDSEDETQQVNKTGKNADGLSGTTTIIENNVGVNEEKAIKPYEENHPKVNLVKSEGYVTDGLDKTQSSESRLYELSAEDLEKEEEEEDEDKGGGKDTSTSADAEASEDQNKEPLSKSAKFEKPEEKVPVSSITSHAKKTSVKPTGKVATETQTYETKQGAPTAAAKKIEAKKATRPSKPKGTKETPNKGVQKNPAKNGGFFKKLAQLLK